MKTARKHGHQPAQKKAAAPDPGLCKHSLQNDGKPDECLGERVGAWNVGSMNGKGVKVCEELRKRRIVMCCLQVMWRGQGAQFKSVMGKRYKLWRSGNSLQGPCRVSMKKFKDFSRTKIIFSSITKIRFLPYKLTIPK